MVCSVRSPPLSNILRGAQHWQRRTPRSTRARQGRRWPAATHSSRLPSRWRVASPLSCSCSASCSQTPPPRCGSVAPLLPLPPRLPSCGASGARRSKVLPPLPSPPPPPRKSASLSKGSSITLAPPLARPAGVSAPKPASVSKCACSSARAASSSYSALRSAPGGKSTRCASHGRKTALTLNGGMPTSAAPAAASEVLASHRSCARYSGALRSISRSAGSPPLVALPRVHSPLASTQRMKVISLRCDDAFTSREVPAGRPGRMWFA
mmetsp:Transcript_37787/g.93523  ORF Transcript_37787/g.93523 Transcript_37787/m.93523 type:complete len:266 (-) Transcript_37787:872-1669(-)